MIFVGDIGDAKILRNKYNARKAKRQALEYKFENFDMKKAIKYDCRRIIVTKKGHSAFQGD